MNRNLKNIKNRNRKFEILGSGTVTKPRRTGSGTGTFNILGTGTETIILLSRVPESNWNF